MQLQAIQRQFIATEDELPPSPTAEDLPPLLRPGTKIDTRIRTLANSVTAALNEYYALATVLDAEVDNSISELPNDATSQDNFNAKEAIQSAERTLDALLNELKRNVTLDFTFRRQYEEQNSRCTRVLSIARAELQRQAFIPPRYIVSTLKAASALAAHLIVACLLLGSIRLVQAFSDLLGRRIIQRFLVGSTSDGSLIAADIVIVVVFVSNGAFDAFQQLKRLDRSNENS